MTKEEIKAAIAANLAGQGSMIDISGKLPAILDAIVDAIPTLPEPYELPVASDEVLGGVKVGEGLAIADDGTLSTGGGGGNEPLIVNAIGLDEISGTITVSAEDLSKIADAYTSGRNVLVAIPGDGYKVTVCGFDSAHYYCVFGLGGPANEKPVYKFVITSE